MGIDNLAVVQDIVVPEPEPSAPPVIAPTPSPAHELLTLFLLTANEYQHKTENDFVVVLSINEELLKVIMLFLLLLLLLVYLYSYYSGTMRLLGQSVL